MEMTAMNIPKVKWNKVKKSKGNIWRKRENERELEKTILEKTIAKQRVWNANKTLQLRSPAAPCVLTRCRKTPQQREMLLFLILLLLLLLLSSSYDSVPGETFVRVSPRLSKRRRRRRKVPSPFGVFIYLEMIVAEPAGRGLLRLTGRSSSFFFFFFYFSYSLTVCVCVLTCVCVGCMVLP